MFEVIFHKIHDTIEFLAQGGILMLPIGLISLIAVSLLLDRLWYYRRVSCDAPRFYEDLAGLVRQERIDEAIAFCERHKSAVVPGALYCVLQHRHRPQEEVEKLVSVYGTREIQKLSRYVRLTGVLGNITPLIGLLGTVIGMVKTFKKIADLSGNVNPSVLAGGIWEALLTTAAGLTVAIPVIMIYHHFESRIDVFMFHMKNYSIELIELLREHDRISA